MILSDEAKNMLISVYRDCVDEAERKETISEMAQYFGTTTMEIRQILQDARVYKAVEGKTAKEQYANALYAVTGISAKEWMKLTAKSQIKLMDLIKKWNKAGYK